MDMARLCVLSLLCFFLCALSSYTIYKDFLAQDITPNRPEIFSSGAFLGLEVKAFNSLS